MLKTNDELDAEVLAMDEARASKPRFKTFALQEFSTKALPARSMVLAPILPAQGIAMAFAPRGVGKTHVALNAAYTVAEGGSFLRWHAPEPRKVLYIDGEMPATALQERLHAIQTASHRSTPRTSACCPWTCRILEHRSTFP